MNKQNGGMHIPTYTHKSGVLFSHKKWNIDKSYKVTYRDSIHMKLNLQKYQIAGCQGLEGGGNDK